MGIDSSNSSNLSHGLKLTRLLRVNWLGDGLSEHGAILAPRWTSQVLQGP